MFGWLKKLLKKPATEELVRMAARAAFAQAVQRITDSKDRARDLYLSLLAAALRAGGVNFTLPLRALAGRIFDELWSQHQRVLFEYAANQLDKAGDKGARIAEYLKNS